MKDNYFTIDDLSLGEYKEKGSKFIAYAFHMQAEPDLFAQLSLIKSEHPKARHYCFAYQLGIDQDLYRTNDDGEPSGTAGKPILGQIHSFQLHHVGIIVVRYFGGTKLGASGLITAYKTAAQEALKAANIVEKIITIPIQCSFHYEDMGTILNDLKFFNVEIISKNFDAQPFVVIGIRRNEVEPMLRAIKARLLNISLDSVHDDTVVPFCTFEILTP